MLDEDAVVLVNAAVVVVVYYPSLSQVSAAVLVLAVVVAAYYPSLSCYCVLLFCLFQVVVSNYYIIFSNISNSLHRPHLSSSAFRITSLNLYNPIRRLSVQLRKASSIAT